MLEQLKKSIAGKLVAVGAADDPQLILRVVHAGPDDYLNEDGDLEGDVDALLNRLRSDRHALGIPGRRSP